MPQNDQKFEQLKQKYQSVQNAMAQQKVRVQNINMQGDKLFIRGEAPSQEVKNKVWDQIKSIDASYSDLICDLTVSQQERQQAPTMAAGASVSGGHSERRYTVKSGDTLSKISQQFYGNSGQYMRIYEANRQVLKSPDKIQPGQELVIPE